MRWQVFEIEDFAWYPQILREGQTDFLRFLMEAFQVFKAVSPLFAKILQETKQNHLQDFCSGAGGAVPLMQKYLKKEGVEITATLSDLYPNTEAYQYLKEKSKGSINFLAKPLDARNIPENTQGFWTIFNGFHHFSPEDAQGILENAIKQEKAIAIFEPLDKSIWQIFINTIALTLVLFLVMPFLKPFRWSRIIFTYLIPIIPLVTLWDGWMSVIRLYTPKDLQEMIQQLPENNYHWEVGKASHTFGVVIYLIAYPKKEKQGLAQKS